MSRPDQGLKKIDAALAFEVYRGHLISYTRLGKRWFSAIDHELAVQDWAPSLRIARDWVRNWIEIDAVPVAG
jgi:hypothetical protein